MGLIKDIRDIQPFIDISNLKGSLQEGDIIVTSFKTYITVFDKEVLYSLDIFDESFTQYHELPIFIGPHGHIYMEDLNDDLSCSNSVFTVKKIYRCTSQLNVKNVKSKIEDIHNGNIFPSEWFLSNQYNGNIFPSEWFLSNQYNLIWER